VNISELEIYLKKAKEKHGDIEVIIDDTDTGWLLSNIDVEAIKTEEGDKISISTDYGNKAYGYIEALDD
jgi:hypothetical protein